MSLKKALVNYAGKIKEIISGDYIDPSFLGSGTRNGTNFLRDDGTWQAVASGGSSGPTTSPYAASTSLGTTSTVALVNASGGAVTMTLPTAVGNANLRHWIKKTDSTANTVTIATALSQTIDGNTTVVIQVTNQTIALISDGTNWYIL